MGNLVSFNQPVAVLLVAILATSTGKIHSHKKFTQSESGPWMVEFENAIEHEVFMSSVQSVYEAAGDSSAEFVITHSYQKAIHGIAVHGLSRAQLEDMEGVTNVQPVMTRYKKAYSWGTDRIDQTSLPLSKSYTPTYLGQGVDAYVVDTGLDTDHIEFADNGLGRTVQNIFNPYGEITSNTDGDGHGTHCAGTVAGNTIGVSKGVNLYGLKVLSDEGSGDDPTIVEAMEMVIARHQSSANKLSVMSMSLGGNCEELYCVDDILTKAAKNVVDAGIVLAVAAGNEYDNACFASPSAAPEAITVGATNIEDGMSYFSNYGQCVDIFAPGTDIVSACTSKSTEEDCSNQQTYIAESGTSMATPHVAGVAAQYLQKYFALNNAAPSPAQVLQAMQCDSVKEPVALGAMDSVSKNMLLQIPSNSTAYGTCNLQEGTCTDSCNGKGFCSPAFKSADFGSTEDICKCDGGYYGAACQLNNGLEYPTQRDCDDSTEFMKVSFKMTGDTYGWNYARYAVIDPSTNVVYNNIIDSLTNDDDMYDDSREYCMAPGVYTFKVKSAENEEDNEGVGWTMCGRSGSAPYEESFEVKYEGGEWVCEFGTYPTAAPTLFPTGIQTFVMFATLKFDNFTYEDYEEEAEHETIFKAALTNVIDDSNVLVDIVFAQDPSSRRRLLQDSAGLEVRYSILVENVLKYGFDTSQEAFDYLSWLIVNSTETTEFIDELYSAADAEGDADHFLDIGMFSKAEIMDAAFPSAAPTESADSSGEGGMSAAEEEAVVWLVVIVVMIAVAIPAAYLWITYMDGSKSSNAPMASRENTDGIRNDQL